MPRIFLGLKLVVQPKLDFKKIYLSIYFVSKKKENIYIFWAIYVWMGEIIVINVG